MLVAVLTLVLGSSCRWPPRETSSSRDSVRLMALFRERLLASLGENRAISKGEG